MGERYLDKGGLSSQFVFTNSSSQDGASEGGELIAPADAGIASLDITPTLQKKRPANGNTLSREGSFTRADGSASGNGNSLQVANDVAWGMMA